MRWARRILIAISLVVALTAVAIIDLHTVELSRFERNFEDYVSEATTRQFVIAGSSQQWIGNATISRKATARYFTALRPLATNCSRLAPP